LKTALTVTEISSLLGISRQATHKKAGKENWPREDNGRKALYPVETLPPNLRRLYLSSEAAPSANVVDFHGQKSLNTLPADMQARPKNLTQKQQRVALARADLINYIKGRKAGARKAGRSITQEARTTLDLYNNGFLLKDVFDVLGNVNIKTVYRWEKRLKDSGNDYSALAPLYGHNRGKFKLTEIEREIFLRVLLQPNRPPIGTAIKLARELLRLQGLRSSTSDASYRRFAKSYKENNNHIWTLARKGEKALEDRVMPYIERDASVLEAGEVLVADGHKLNFQVLNPFTGKPARAMLVVFFDWASRFPCGYEIMMSEDVQCIHSALRRSIMALGKVPEHVLLDNGKAFKAKLFTSDVDLEQCGAFGLYSRLGINVRFASPYNAKDKLVERFFRTFNDLVERMMPSYIGASIKDKPAYMNRNEKFHKSLHNPAVPTIEQAIALVAKGIELYATQEHSGLKGRTPSEVFAAGRGPGVDHAELNHLMMSMDIKTMYRNGVRLFGGHYWSDALVGYKGQSFVKYDIHDLTKVQVYDSDGGFLCEAERVTKFDPLMRGSDRAAMQDFMKKKAGIRKVVKQAVLAVHGNTDSLPPVHVDDSMSVISHVPELTQAPVTEQGPEAAPELFFEYGWQRYEFLQGQPELTEEESTWVEDYESGRICPGEFKSVYGGRSAAVS